MNNITQIQNPTYNRVAEGINFDKVSGMATVIIQNHIEGQNLESSHIPIDFKALLQTKSVAVRQGFLGILKEIVAEGMNVPIEEIIGEFEQ